MSGPRIKGNCKWSNKNIDIIGISDLKWNGMGEFNSDDHYIYYCGQESLRRNGVAFIVNKSLKCRIVLRVMKVKSLSCVQLFATHEL